MASTHVDPTGPVVDGEAVAVVPESPDSPATSAAVHLSDEDQRYYIHWQRIGFDVDSGTEPQESVDEEPPDWGDSEDLEEPA